MKKSIYLLALSLLFLTNTQNITSQNTITPMVEVVDMTKRGKPKKQKSHTKLLDKLYKVLNNNSTKKGIISGASTTLALFFIRRKAKKRIAKIRQSKLSPSGDKYNGCLRALLVFAGIILLSLFGSWLMTAVFGVSVSFWLGALIGAAILGAIFGIIYLIVKR